MINWSRIEDVSTTSSVKELMLKLSVYSRETGFDNFGVAVQFFDLISNEMNFFAIIIIRMPGKIHSANWPIALLRHATQELSYR
jgi:hypothetical protein